MPSTVMAGAIFDMDGTILDSSPMWESVEGSVLLEFGYEPKPTLRRDCLPLGALDTAPFLKRDYGMRESLEEINAGIDRRISQYYFREAALKPGALGFLQTLKRNGVRLALATATDRKYALPALELTGVLPLFDAVLTCAELGHTKREPHIFLRAMELMGTDTASTWLFEDALYAIRTAKRLGVTTCAVADPASAFQWNLLMQDADYHLLSFLDWQDTLPLTAQALPHGLR